MSEVKVFKNPYRRWTHFSTSSSTGEHVMFVSAKTGGFIDNNQTHQNRKSARFRRTTICNGVNYATTPNGDVMRLSNSGPNANDPLPRRRPERRNRLLHRYEDVMRLSNSGGTPNDPLCGRRPERAKYGSPGQRPGFAIRPIRKAPKGRNRQSARPCATGLAKHCGTSLSRPYRA